MLPIPKRANSRSVKQELLAMIRLGVKQKLQWDYRYRMVEHHRKNLPKKYQILELFRSPSTPREVWDKLQSQKLEKSEDFAHTLQRAIALKLLKEDFPLPEFDKPIFIISAPRAGSTLLFESLSQFPQLWTVGKESHAIIEGIPQLRPAAHNFSSNCLTEADAQPHISLALREGFARQLRDRFGMAYLHLPIQQRPQKIRFLEKTPKNALRVPFLKAVFPDALFIFLYREPRSNINSILEGWRSGHFISAVKIPGWPFRNWSFLLIPGWSSLSNSSIAEIAAHQWKTANSYIWDSLQSIPPSSWCLVRYQDLVREPQKAIREISEFAGLSWNEQIEERLSQPLPISGATLSQPSADKWLTNERDILEVLPMVEPIANMLEMAKV
ncbi:MAG TPA: sulfotransferase [Cyanobacteria bacterium UBA11149]|nr:sulfotransferase [Cyanobacteria bacterium UBA11367]HBE55971.1 sulfotransferase [Cyanobacteria bacterium UBA11366]HBK63199.1 sulfotransferase [Cyanobacteria bacterium UBA11166]HBR74755.1 sulfotransferase [Cyanobacteria bacterium UBA11159]HBS72522.1 sulfotransferase [Cyanobacteria bacterium UBA11153]HBW88691.1 sulfotransferase [Cyanobacteria bacterium UBA11149]HCA94503.1 sulfotransferase [Cyanobacteria bacterium UBA9226]